MKLICLQIRWSKSSWWRKTELTAGNNRHQHWSCFKRLPIPGLCYSKTSLTPTGIQNLDKLPETLESLVVEISVLNLRRPIQQTWKQGYSPRSALDTSPFLVQNLPSQLLLNNTWKKTVLNCFKTSGTTEIKKNDGDHCSLDWKRNLPFRCPSLRNRT